MDDTRFLVIKRDIRIVGNPDSTVDVWRKTEFCLTEEGEIWRKAISCILLKNQIERHFCKAEVSSVKDSGNVIPTVLSNELLQAFRFADPDLSREIKRMQNG